VRIPRSNKTITEAEIRDVTHYCHWIAARQVTCDSHFSGFAPRAKLSHVNFLSDGTLEVVMMKLKSEQSPALADDQFSGVPH